MCVGSEQPDWKPMCRGAICWGMQSKAPQSAWAEASPIVHQPAAALLAAIEAGDSESLRRLFAQGIDPATTCGDRFVDLVAFCAADTGAVELVRPFIDAGLPVDVQIPGDSTGATLLSAAATNGCLPLVEYLVGQGADVNHSEQGDTNDPDAGTVLTNALMCDDPSPFVSVLLNAGADPNLARADGWTPLMLAARGGDAAIVRALLAAGAQVRAVKGTGNRRTTALSVAHARCHFDITTMLRDSGAVDLVDGACEVAEWRAAQAIAVTSHRHEESDPAEADACAARLTTIVSDINDRLTARAAGAGEKTRVPRGSAVSIPVAELEAAIGEPLPTDFRSYLRLFGETGGVDLREYDGMQVPEILSTWRGLTEHLAEGSFNHAEPHELHPDDRCVRYRWWHPGWIPFAQDGGGNLHCVDLAPDRDGVRGQVISWEIRGGPLGVRAPSIEQFLMTYRRNLAGTGDGFGNAV